MEFHFLEVWWILLFSKAGILPHKLKFGWECDNNLDVRGHFVIECPKECSRV